VSPFYCVKGISSKLVQHSFAPLLLWVVFFCTIAESGWVLVYDQQEDTITIFTLIVNVNVNCTTLLCYTCEVKRLSVLKAWIEP
jgi:hypothetical protein